MRLFLAILGAVVLAVLGTTPPNPRGTNAPATEFSAARAMIDVREIARAPHPTGTPENARVRGMLVAKLRALDLEVHETQSVMDAKSADRLANWTHHAGPVPPLTNIVAVLRGTDQMLPRDPAYGAPRHRWWFTRRGGRQRGRGLDPRNTARTKGRRTTSAP